MADSLQDQLLKLGLAKSKPARKKKPGRKRTKSGNSGRPPNATGGEPSLAQAYAQRDRLEKKQSEETARRKKAENERRRKLNEQLKAIIEPAARNDADADQERYFEFAGKIRKVYVTGEQLKQVNQGQLGIVSFRGRYLLLARDVIERVEKIKPEAVAFVADGADEED
ncbi:MAG: DUF2058 family protein [Xanthomonadales bacterium]|nr:DUF2058 family protein [Xanthomonadales bacterium]